MVCFYQVYMPFLIYLSSPILKFEINLIYCQFSRYHFRKIMHTIVSQCHRSVPFDPCTTSAFRLQIYPRSDVCLYCPGITSKLRTLFLVKQESVPLFQKFVVFTSAMTFCQTPEYWQIVCIRNQRVETVKSKS